MASPLGRASIGRSAPRVVVPRWDGGRAARASYVRIDWIRFVCAGIAIAFLLYGVWTVTQLDRDAVLGYFGLDRRIYMVATERWLAGGPFYEPYQLAGPYQIDRIEILYPPILLWIMVPFQVLPASLWWGIPLGVTAWAVLRLRPTAIVWPLLALCVFWPATDTHILTGNPVMWAVAALSVGVIYVGPAVFVLIKPSLAPFALWGIRRRRWWLGVLVFGALSVPFGALWLDWLIAIGNSRGGGLLYSIQDVPMLAVPVIAWLARSGNLRGGRGRRGPQRA